MADTNSKQFAFTTSRAPLHPALATALLATITMSSPVLAAAPNDYPAGASAASGELGAPRATSASYIVQAPNFAVAIAAVKNAGGNITQEFGIINAVVANLTVAQTTALRADHWLTLVPNGSATAS